MIVCFMPLHVSSTMCSSLGGQTLYYTASGIITPIGGRPVHRLREDWMESIPSSRKAFHPVLSLYCKYCIEITVTDTNAWEFCSRKLHVCATGAVSTAEKWTSYLIKYHSEF